jgi:hypothetical protein
VIARWLRVEEADAVRVIQFRLVVDAMGAEVAPHATGAEPS